MGEVWVGGRVWVGGWVSGGMCEEGCGVFVLACVWMRDWCVCMCACVLMGMVCVCVCVRVCVCILISTFILLSLDNTYLI